MKPAVVLHDTLDDRREVWAALLRGLTFDQRRRYHAWVCDLANLTCPSLTLATGGVSVDAARMGKVWRAAREGDTLANVAHANEIFLDVAMLCHQWGLDYLACLVELENRAKGREETPARYAAVAMTARQSRLR